MEFMTHAEKSSFSPAGNENIQFDWRETVPTRKKLAILCTHPIQYHAHWFRALARHPKLEVSVFYCYQASPADQARAGFGVEFDWDTPLLEGYPHRFLKNVARGKTFDRFLSLDTPEIKEIIGSGRFDAVLVNGWHYKSAWQAILSCWRSGTPVMLRGDSHLHTPRSTLKKILKYPFYRSFISRADACLAAGTWSRDYYLHYGVRPERVFLVPHTLDEGWFTRAAATWLPHHSELRRRWDLDEEAVVFLFVGKFIEKKRPMDFVQAVESAARTNSRVFGLMVGDGPLRPVCEAFVRENRCPVRFSGFLNQSEIVLAYVVADALVVPSDGRETWGLVVNEAMACGRPCIVSDVVGCGVDLVVPSETGAIFPLGDLQGLAKLLLAYAENKAHLPARGAAAREKLRSYSVDAAVEGVLQAMAAIEKVQPSECTTL
jgi:glycosyltransferase involved in cell wall biosynthesis